MSGVLTYTTLAQRVQEHALAEEQALANHLSTVSRHHHSPIGPQWNLLELVSNLAHVRRVCSLRNTCMCMELEIKLMNMMRQL
jgi:hypothetical protein